MLIVTVHSYDLCIKLSIHEILFCFKQSDIMILFTACLCGVKFCENVTLDACWYPFRYCIQVCTNVYNVSFMLDTCFKPLKFLKHDEIKILNE